MLYLFAISSAALLSQYNINSFARNKTSSINRIRNHNTSHTPCAMDLNSTFAVDRATTLCFLLRHVTKLPPTNVQ
uniref:Uncharacterized protein n=1 Tax=Arundo donax TaxID=35708 RepID=A0A0A9G5L6_ARUDO